MYLINVLLKCLVKKIPDRLYDFRSDIIQQHHPSPPVEENSALWKKLKTKIHLIDSKILGLFTFYFVSPIFERAAFGQMNQIFKASCDRS